MGRLVIEADGHPDLGAAVCMRCNACTIKNAWADIVQSWAEKYRPNTVNPSSFEKKSQRSWVPARIGLRAFILTPRFPVVQQADDTQVLPDRPMSISAPRPMTSPVHV